MTRKQATVTLTQPDRYPYGRHPRTVPSRRIRARTAAEPKPPTTRTT